MGRVVAETADTLIVTNDNPRTEDPLQIIDDILTGIKPEDLHRVLIEPERDLAIKLAIKVSEDGDVLIISGKGAETYQLIGDIKHPFDDREVARKALSQAGWAK
jgi:UDP-N-acetylmuramoyl-L-alanyl-D-glutamate--2,6-diaminopimelate ligase